MTEPLDGVVRQAGSVDASSEPGAPEVAGAILAFFEEQASAVTPCRMSPPPLGVLRQHGERAIPDVTRWARSSRRRPAKPLLDPREESDCLLDDAASGYFDPAPEVNLEYSPDDIKF